MLQDFFLHIQCITIQIFPGFDLTITIKHNHKVFQREIFKNSTKVLAKYLYFKKRYSLSYSLSSLSAFSPSSSIPNAQEEKKTQTQKPNQTDSPETVGILIRIASIASRQATDHSCYSIYTAGNPWSTSSWPLVAAAADGGGGDNWTRAFAAGMPTTPLGDCLPSRPLVRHWWR